MYRIIFTIVAVLLFVGPSQAVKVEQGGKVLTEHAVQMGGKRSPLGPNAPVQSSAGTFHGVNFVTETPACETPFTGFPVTFEGTGTCSAQETAIVLETGGPMDCDYTTTVLEGSESMYVNSNLGAVWLDLGKTITTPVRVAFLYQYIARSTNNSIVFSFGAGGIGRDPRIYNPWYTFPNRGFRIYDVGEAVGSAILPNDVTGNPLKICIEWDPTLDDTTFYTDPIDGEWCVGASGTLTLTSPSTPATDVNRVVFLRGGNHDDYVVDNVTACDAP